MDIQTKSSTLAGKLCIVLFIELIEAKFFDVGTQHASCAGKVKPGDCRGEGGGSINIPCLQSKSRSLLLWQMANTFPCDVFYFATLSKAVVDLTCINT